MTPSFPFNSLFSNFAIFTFKLLNTPLSTKLVHSLVSKGLKLHLKTNNVDLFHTLVFQ